MSYLFLACPTNLYKSICLFLWLLMDVIKFTKQYFLLVTQCTVKWVSLWVSIHTCMIKSYLTGYNLYQVHTMSSWFLWIFQIVRYVLDFVHIYIYIYDKKICQTPTHNIQEHWIAVSTLLGLISSLYHNLHLRSNQRPQIAVPKLYKWATSSYHNILCQNKFIMTT